MLKKIKGLLTKIFKKQNNDFTIKSEGGKNSYTKNGNTVEITNEEMRTIMKESKITKLSFTENNVSYINEIWGVWNKHRENGTSEFGERVILKTNSFKSTMTLQDTGTYFGDMDFSFDVIGEISKEEHYTYTANFKGFNCPVALNEQHIKNLITLAFSGCYATPYDFDNFYQTIFIVTKQDAPNDLYKCSVCDTPFATLEPLLEHIKETKHKDNIINWLPHYKYFNN